MQRNSARALFRIDSALELAFALARTLGGDFRYLRSLAAAPVARITPRDFLTARKSGTYRHYARPLSLACAVLTRTGFDPSQPINENGRNQAVRLVPFRLTTAELCERYVEVCLRRVQGLKLWAGYRDQNLGESFKIRPDFLVRANNHRIVIDAKYKNIANQNPVKFNENNPLRYDIYQALAHAHHNGVTGKLGGKATKIVFCYPQAADNACLENAAECLQPILYQEPIPPNGDTIQDFDIPISKFGLYVPVRHA